MKTLTMLLCSLCWLSLCFVVLSGCGGDGTDNGSPGAAAVSAEKGEGQEKIAEAGKLLDVVEDDIKEAREKIGKILDENPKFIEIKLSDPESILKVAEKDIDKAERISKKYDAFDLEDRCNLLRTKIESLRLSMQNRSL